LPADVVVDEREFRSAAPLQRQTLRKIARRLEERPYLGERIRKDLVPPSFRKLPNLFRIELPDGWRALYAVITKSSTREVRVVWIGNHKRYDRLFGY